MPLIFAPDANGTLRFAGHATVECSSNNPTEHVIDDLDLADLTPEQRENPRRLVLTQHPAQDRGGRSVVGRPDDPQQHSRHVRRDDVTLGMSDPPEGEE